MAVTVLVAVVTGRGAPLGTGLTRRVADFVAHGPSGLVGLPARLVDASADVAHERPDESPDVLGHAPELIIGRHICRVSRRRRRGISPPAEIRVSRSADAGPAVHASRAVGNVPSVSETVEFASNGNSASGYLARPPEGSGPGVLVVQEWWGLDWGIKLMADRLAEAGFVALAPDLYHGQLAGHDEMDKAGQLMAAMPPDRAARDMSGAVDYLASHEAVAGDGLGVVGFCMGGMLALMLAANRPDRIKAVVTFYGYPQGESEPDWTKMTAAVRGHMAENDDFFGPAGAAALEQKLRAMGKDATFTVHPNTGHAFMAPHNALGTLDEKLAAEIWPGVVSFLHDTLG